MTGRLLFRRRARRLALALAAALLAGSLLSVGVARASTSTGTAIDYTSSCSSTIAGNGGSCSAFFNWSDVNATNATVVLIGSDATSCSFGLSLWVRVSGGSADVALSQNTTPAASSSGPCRFDWPLTLKGVQQGYFQVQNDSSGTLTLNKLVAYVEAGPLATVTVANPVTTVSVGNTVTVQQAGTVTTSCTSGCSGGGTGGTVDISRSGIAAGFLNNLHDDIFVIVGAVIGAALIPLITRWFLGTRG